MVQRGFGREFGVGHQLARPLRGRFEMGIRRRQGQAPASGPRGLGTAIWLAVDPDPESPALATPRRPHNPGSPPNFSRGFPGLPIVTIDIKVLG